MANTFSTNSEAFKTFQRQLAGSVSLPGDSNYDKQRTPWLQVLDQRPAAIVNAATPDDVAQSVRFAAESGAELGVQNTGHGISAPCNGGILLRLSEMKTIDIDANAQTVTIGPGVESGALVGELESSGLAYPSGQVSNVGAMGYTLGGGVGWLLREDGAACYSLLGATVVLADGSTVVASDKEHADLLWALRGGGGNFGVVVSMTLKARPLAKVFGGMIYFRLDEASAIVQKYRKWTATLGNSTSTIVRLMKLPPRPPFQDKGLTETCAIGVCHTDGSTAEKLHRELSQMQQPVVDLLEMRPYSKMAEFDEASSMSGSKAYSQTDYLRELSDATIERLVSIAKTKMPPLMTIELQHLGGALTAAANGNSAYQPPRAPFGLHIVSPVMKTSLDELKKATTEAFASLGSAFTGEASYNFLRGDEEDRLPNAFGNETFARLRQVKKKYDPANLFHLNHNIQPA